MIYLVFEMLLFLFLAALLGILVGWLMRGGKVGRLKRQVKHLESEIATLREAAPAPPAAVSVAQGEVSRTSKTEAPEDSEKLAPSVADSKAAASKVEESKVEEETAKPATAEADRKQDAPEAPALPLPPRAALRDDGDLPLRRAGPRSGPTFSSGRSRVAPGPSPQEVPGQQAPTQEASVEKTPTPNTPAAGSGNGAAPAAKVNGAAPAPSPSDRAPVEASKTASPDQAEVQDKRVESAAEKTETSGNGSDSASEAPPRRPVQAGYAAPPGRHPPRFGRRAPLPERPRRG